MKKIKQGDEQETDWGCQGGRDRGNVRCAWKHSHVSRRKSVGMFLPVPGGREVLN